MFLSAGWLEEVLELGKKLPKSAGVNLKIDFEINKTPKNHEAAGKKIRCFAEITDGQLKKLEGGTAKGADVSVRCEYKDILKAAGGELDIEAAYMQGAIKLDGDYTLVLFGLRDFFSSKHWVGFLEKVRSSL